MLRSLVVPILFSASALAGAQTLNFADVKAKNATQLGADDLRTLVPGAKVVSRTSQGSTRTWENKPDGTFTACRMAVDPAEGETVMPPARALGGSKTTGRYV